MQASSLKETELLREEVFAKAETLKVLPTLNTIISELLRVMNDPNSSFNQLFKIVKYDQAISSKIISIANSAYYSRGATVVNLERAMVVIGFEEIKNIVMCLAFLKEVLGRWNLRQQDLTVLWMHSLKVGYAAKILSADTMIEDPEKAFTVSILHDLGKAVLYMYGEQYRNLIEEARRTGMDICILERETFGVDHQEVGYFMSVKWRFPEEFSNVIRRHHARPDGQNALVDLVRAADLFITNPKADLGAQSIILQREKERIESEAKRISELLGVANGGK
ncbi:MAG: phosphodiesterase [Syntrophorhabdaceae bacterium PtaU1.Bin034]|jgi:putative nucleotidyltransferase with HDIG domain|nr:MAG: phosphodiesterase [Syntrophorhabdaceae bacterium PtaU1.Bin034]